MNRERAQAEHHLASFAWINPASRAREVGTRIKIRIEAGVEFQFIGLKRHEHVDMKFILAIPITSLARSTARRMAEVGGSRTKVKNPRLPRG